MLVSLLTTAASGRELGAAAACKLAIQFGSDDGRAAYLVFSFRLCWRGAPINQPDRMAPALERFSLS